jgi:cytochrome oxidase Cu insertion factor (SCO1/SenC/PrrC family)
LKIAHKEGKTMFRKKQFFFIVLLILLFSGSYMGCKGQNEAATDVTDVQGSETDVSDLMSLMNFRQIAGQESVPDFRLKSVDGDWVELNDYRGKIVLVSFWATW